jgi:hypothetical protein
MSTPRTDVEVLENTIKAIEGEGNWCKGAFFKDAGGEQTDAYHAEQYCLEGAISVATLRYVYANTHPVFEECCEQEQRVQKVLRKIIQERGLGLISSGIPGYNDDKHTTKEDAVLLVKYGIEAVQSEETM